MKKIIYSIALIFLYYACSTDSSSNNTTDQSNTPSSVNLIFPYNNSLCNEGTNVTATQSTVLFEWGAGENTDSYSLQLKNITTGNSTSHQTTNTQIAVVLDRATQYTWYVVSQSNNVSETAQSEVWQFYNAGLGTQNYVPFPAQILSPTMAEIISTTSNEISLEWRGSDLDDDIVGYDVYFGTENPPNIYANDQAEITLVVPVSSSTIYYWYIITKDASSNTSNSGVYQFRIE